MARRPDRCRKALKLMESITITIMAAIFFIGMSSNLSINKTLDSYSHKNIFTAKLTFKDKFQLDEEIDYELSSNINDTKSNPIHQISSKIFNSTTNLNENESPMRLNRNEYNQSTNDRQNEIASRNDRNREGQKRNIKNTLTDDEFIKQKKVDLYSINAKKKALQEYLVFYPLITLIVATSWGALLICFRSGGYCNDEWVSIGPWRIVIPSVVCFSVMSVASAVYVFLSNKYSNRLCKNLGSELTYPENYTCGYLLEKLAPVNSYHVFSTSTQFKIYRISIKIDLILWFAALCIMSIRWLLAIDFELVKIALSPYYRDVEKVNDSEFEEPTTLNETKITQLSGTVPDEDYTEAEELPKKSTSDSRDDLDDFQSAHSQLNGSGDHNASEFSSLEPLIQMHSSQKPHESENIIKSETV